MDLRGERGNLEDFYFFFFYTYCIKKDSRMDDT